MYLENPHVFRKSKAPLSSTFSLRKAEFFAASSKTYFFSNNISQGRNGDCKPILSYQEKYHISLVVFNSSESQYLNAISYVRKRW